MIKSIHIVIWLSLLLLASPARAHSVKGYFVAFTDKAQNPYSINAPEDYLSARAIERRTKQNIPITEQDLPVSPVYTDSLKKLGLEVKHTTKWLNGCIVFSSDVALMDTLYKYGFINFVELTYQPYGLKSAKLETAVEGTKSAIDDVYGKAFDQINTVHGIPLHEKGFEGQDKVIAVIDAGFYGVDQLPAFEHLWQNNQILGTRDFVNPASNIYEEHTHGMQVLSIIGGLIDEGPAENIYKGTAPKAKFWLLRTEDNNSEYPIEADYWICGAEFADSAGVDVINTSLGYSTFDEVKFNYTFSQMDGSTRISQAATIAASTGMVVVISAGNEGNNMWHYITAPADARDVLTIGAMSADSLKAGFSSVGPTYDNRIKPDVSAMGVKTAIQLSNGNIGTGNGTSFSAPVIAGMAACLWQSLSTHTAQEITELIKNTSHQANSPDKDLGYGIPDFAAAYHTPVDEVLNAPLDNWLVHPNPCKNTLVLKRKGMFIDGTVQVCLYDLAGKLKYTTNLRSTSEIYVDIPSFIRDGMYILHIKDGDHLSQHKIMKEGFY